MNLRQGGYSLSRRWSLRQRLYHPQFSGWAQPRPSGSALGIVLLMIFIILTLIMMTFATTDVTRQALLRSHNELVGRQVLRFELAKTTLGMNAPLAPSWLATPLKRSWDRSFFLTPDFIKDVYKESPSLALGTPLENGIKGYPGQRYVKYRMLDGTAHLGVLSENFPYAAMSFDSGSKSVPSLQFDSVRPWLNPLFDEVSKPEYAASGTAPLLMATGDVSVPDFPYGFLYQANSAPKDIRLGSKQLRPVGVALAADSSFRGVGEVDPNAYRTMLRAQIAELLSTQKRRAEAVDQSALIDQYVGRTDLMGIFFSGAAVPKALKERLSLRNSQSFWLPSIPGIQKQYGLIWHLMFHVPAPPDGGLDGVARDAMKILKTVMKAVDALETALGALDSAQDALTQAMKDAAKMCTCDGWPWNWPCCVAIGAAEVALAVAKIAVKAAEIAVGAAEAAVMVLISPLTLQMTAILASGGQLPTPVTRDEEARYSAITQGAKIDKKGADYWAYRQIFNGIGGFFEDLFTNPSEIGKNFGNDVNVVFFGHSKKRQGWNFSAPTFIARATMNVPPGRSFHFHRGLTVQGDLWIGRGATCVIRGDLIMEPGDPYRAEQTGGPAPEGVVYLEEGATLIVDGKFVGRGTRALGSVMVGGPIGAVHGVSSALLVGKNADLPHGVSTGVGLDRLRKPAAGKKEGPVSDVPAPVSEAFLRPLINEWGPNLAKVDGPFHTRLPYIARYATTFELITPPGIPMVLPMNFPNLHVTVFRGLTMLYAPTLNFELGENFMTHSDWWSGGWSGGKASSEGGDEGKVPVILKRVAQEMCYRGGVMHEPTTRTSKSTIRASVDKRATQIGGAEVEHFANSLILKLLADILQGLTGKVNEKIPMVSWGMIFDKAITGAAKFYYNLDDREKALDSIVSQEASGDIGLNLHTIFSSIETMERVAKLTQSAVTQECSGALIYAGGNLTVGSGDGTYRTPISSGFFVSEGDMRLESLVTVGSAISLNGTLHGRILLYFPGFSHASIPLLPSRTGDWKTRGLDKNYGGDGDPVPTSHAVGSWRARLATDIRGGL